MIGINYQIYGTRGFQLRLRFYQDGETKYINVNKILKGNLQKRHWNVKKKCLYSSAPYAEENNATLDEFKAKYEERAAEWHGTLAGFLMSFDKADEAEEQKTLLWCFQYFIDEMKKHNVNEDGTISGGYEPYEKTVKRFEEFCSDKKICWERVTLQDVTPQFVNQFFDWIRGRNVGRCVYVSNTLKAVLRKSEKLGWFDFHPFVNCNWIKKEGKSSKKYPYSCLLILSEVLASVPRFRPLLVALS